MTEVTNIKTLRSDLVLLNNVSSLSMRRCKMYALDSSLGLNTVTYASLKNTFFLQS